MSNAAKGKKDEPEKKPRRRIKKVAGHGGHHGGAWKVAYADFVTAMMALFLVLWLLSQADQKLKESIANYFRSPGVFTSQSGTILAGPKKVSQTPTAQAEQEEAMLNGIATSLKKQISTNPELSPYKDRVKIEVTNEGLKIQIIDKADKVTFASGSAELSADAKTLLNEIAKAICALPNAIAIGGHTDKHLFPEGSSYTNWELSGDRANAARRALEAACVKPEQVRRVIGYADTELLYPNQPFAAANRRINITVLRLYKAPQSESKTSFVEGKDSAKEKEKEPGAEEQSSKKAVGGEKEAEAKDEEPAPTEKVRGKGQPTAAKKNSEEAGDASPAATSTGKHAHK